MTSQTGLRAARRPRRHPHALAAPGIQRQPVLRGAVQDDEIPARLPRSLHSLAAARTFCAGFFAEYNHVHRHSGIGWHTPASVHFDAHHAVDDARQATLNTAYAAHPERFTRRPAPPRIPAQSWINQPEKLQNN